MAQRIGAGGYFQSFEHIDDYGSSRPPSRAAGRPVTYDDYSECDSDDTSPHSPQPQPHVWGPGQRHDRDRGLPELRWSPSPSPEHQFFIIREGTPATPPPREPLLQPNDHRQHQYHYPYPPPPRENAASPGHGVHFKARTHSMERTDSGRRIVNDTDPQPDAYPEFSPEDDGKAAWQVEQHLAKPHARGNVKRHERILRTLINPRDKAADFPLDNAALESIFSAADKIFFQGRLSCRVHWEWSSGCANVVGTVEGSRIIGTTALRERAPGDFETLMVLSSPILKDTSYNRRLLISTFLHEMIHSYLFICCGFKARHCGGHTEGFKKIARLIDEWEGQGSLRLCDMEADLEHFREEPPLRPSLDDDYPTSCHHHGGVDFYDLKAAPWSTGPRVVFSAQDQGNEGRRSTGSSMPLPIFNYPSPLSSATKLVENAEWGGYDDPDAFLRQPGPAW